MKWAVISDIHANLLALQETIKHLESQGADGVLCTGDLTIYGPHPNECVELMFSLLGEYWSTRCMLGNSDLVVVRERADDSLSQIALASFKWTNEVVSAENRRRLSQLRQEPIVIEDHLTVVHGTLPDPMGEFTYMDRDDFTVKESLRSLHTPLGLFGHTHKPAIYKAIPKPSPHILPLEKEYPQYTRQDAVGLYEVTFAEDLERGKRLLICAGSVGQPRDGDPRAAYLLIDEEKQLLQFCRVPYDIRSVQDEMRRVGTPEALIERLEKGA